MWCNSSSWAIYVQLSIGCRGDDYSLAFCLEDPTLMITKRLNFYLGLWLEKSESVWGFLQCIHLFCWKLALVNQNSWNLKFQASQVLSQLCKSWRSWSKSPSLKSKTSPSTYAEQTFGFPQLPNARRELLFLAVRQVKVNLPCFHSVLDLNNLQSWVDESWKHFCILRPNSIPFRSSWVPLLC